MNLPDCGQVAKECCRRNSGGQDGRDPSHLVVSRSSPSLHTHVMSTCYLARVEGSARRRIGARLSPKKGV